jgi:thioredoxin-dependent peroxiredoxin
MLETGKPFVNFNLQNQDGKQMKLADFAGKWLVVHKNFANKFAFTIDLLADTNAAFLKEAGIGQTEFNGTKYWNRTSFVIDPNGNLRKVYEKVNPNGHEKVLLEDIKAMQRG